MADIPAAPPAAAPIAAAPAAPAPAPTSSPASASQGHEAATPPVVTSPEAAPAAFSPVTPVNAEPVAVVPAEASPAPEAPKPAESLLSQAVSKPADAPAEAPVAEAPKPAEATTLPTFTDFVLPEGMALEPERLSNLTKVLGEMETTKGIDHAVMQEMGQKMVDLHIQEIQEFQRQHDQERVQVWNQIRDGWKDEFKNDPDIGGNRQETTLKQAGAVIERFGQKFGAEKESALRLAFSTTGLGDHPELIRFVNWVASFTTERARPVAAIVPKSPAPTSRSARRYGGSNSQGNGAA